MASKLFPRSTREHVWLLYAWCRKCDDIIDEHGHDGQQQNTLDKTRKVKAIRVLTHRAFEGKPTADPAFDAFGLVASECRIAIQEADALITGFDMDASDWRPRDEADLLQYCYHVAGSVGVMMARIMGVPYDDDDTLDRACDLGIAFQLANIARDIVDDDAAGRCYLPVEWLVEEDIEPGQHTKPHHRQELADMALRLVDLMDHYALASRHGAARLSFRHRWAVLSATRIYTAIGHKVRENGTKAWDQRITIDLAEKISHTLAAFFQALINRPPSVQEMPYWTRSSLALRHASA